MFTCVINVCIARHWLKPLLLRCQHSIHSPFNSTATYCQVHVGHRSTVHPMSDGEHPMENIRYSMEVTGLCWQTTKRAPAPSRAIDQECQIHPWYIFGILGILGFLGFLGILGILGMLRMLEMFGSLGIVGFLGIMGILGMFGFWGNVYLWVFCDF